MAMWPSWPHACMQPAWREAKARPVRSVTGKASMSERTAVACDVPRSKKQQTVEVAGLKTVLSQGSASRTART